MLHRFASAGPSADPQPVNAASHLGPGDRTFTVPRDHYAPQPPPPDAIPPPDWMRADFAKSALPFPIREWHEYCAMVGPVLIRALMSVRGASTERTLEVLGLFHEHFRKFESIVWIYCRGRNTTSREWREKVLPGLPKKFRVKVEAMLDNIVERDGGGIGPDDGVTGLYPGQGDPNARDLSSLNPAHSCCVDVVTQTFRENSPLVAEILAIQS
ncbi:hypothetical protein R3P38DRAFT_2787173 [Favolaschia claudopus]|uniref:Uncharacterized protein n=1 Tax=Favolaschia claudopus TaxID=2862362 RepID=A0AAW0AQ51_9AGAR